MHVTTQLWTPKWGVIKDFNSQKFQKNVYHIIYPHLGSRCAQKSAHLLLPHDTPNPLAIWRPPHLHCEGLMSFIHLHLHPTKCNHYWGNLGLYAWQTNGLYCGKVPQLVSLISSSFMNFMMFYSWYSKGSNGALQDLFKIYTHEPTHIALLYQFMDFNPTFIRDINNLPLILMEIFIDSIFDIFGKHEKINKTCQFNTLCNCDTLCYITKYYTSKH
jgi:hypothetical protein